MKTLIITLLWFNFAFQFTADASDDPEIVQIEVSRAYAVSETAKGMDGSIYLCVQNESPSRQLPTSTIAAGCLEMSQEAFTSLVKQCFLVRQVDREGVWTFYKSCPEWGWSKRLPAS